MGLLRMKPHKGVGGAEIRVGHHCWEDPEHSTKNREIRMKTPQIVFPAPNLGWYTIALMKGEKNTPNC